MDPNAQLVLYLSVGLLSLAALGVGIAAAWRSSRRQGDPTPARSSATGPSTPPDEHPADGDGALAAPRRHIRDRVVRIVALSYLAAVAVVVSISGGWGADASTIYLLVASGTLAVVLFGDLIADRLPSSIRGWTEGAVAIVVVTAITGVTGGVLSPFAAGYFLIVGAAALSRDTLAAGTVALVAALAAAAVDLLVWPSRDGVPVSIVAAILFLGVALLLLAAVVTIASREHQRAQDAALRLARFDPLTGLYNRTHFFTELEREIRLAQRAGRTFALLMIDVDGLKPVNDAFGHHYGDQLLTGVTSVIRATVRATDTPARYGGDEFVVLLPETDVEGAYVVAEKLRHDIAAFSIQVSDRTVRTSVSLGLVSYPDDGTTADSLMAAADAALYEAKRSGRDRIVGYTTRMERVATRLGAADRRAVPSMPRDLEPAPTPTRPTPGPAVQVPTVAGPAPARPAPTLTGPGPTLTGPAPARPAPTRAPVDTVVAAGAAPWETGTNADWETRGRARVVVPIEPDDQAGSTGHSGRAV